MEVIYVFNGLGNQMSQYSLFLHKRLLGQKVMCIFKNSAHNGIELNKLFNVDTINNKFFTFYDLLFKVALSERYLFFKRVIFHLLRLFNTHFYLENRNYSYNSDIIRSNKGFNLYIGGWHHYRYNNDIEVELRKVFKFPPFISDRNKALELEAQNKNAVAIHIRKGDYCDSENYSIFGCVCDESYYKKAIAEMEELVENPIYYVFSNERKFAMNLFGNRNVVFVDWNTGEDSWADMALMSKFNNIIIANSTFSWWAAWIGPNNKTVICPRFFVHGDANSDIFKPDWIKV